MYALTSSASTYMIPSFLLHDGIFLTVSLIPPLTLVAVDPRTYATCSTVSLLLLISSILFRASFFASSGVVDSYPL